MNKKNSFKSVHNFHSWEKDNLNEFDSVLRINLVKQTQLKQQRKHKQKLDNALTTLYSTSDSNRLDGSKSANFMMVLRSTVVTVQRYFRGWNIRKNIPNIRAEYYSRMAGEGLGHQTIFRGFRDNPKYPLQYVSMDWLNNEYDDEESNLGFSHHLWGKPLEERTSSRKVGFSQDSDLRTEEETPIRDFDGPKPENLIIGKIITEKWASKLEDEEDFHSLFPEITDEELAVVVAYFSKSLTALKNGKEVMIWDGSSKKVKPFWITTSGGKGQAARFEEVYRVLAIVYNDMKIRYLKEILQNYEFDCGECNVTPISMVPAVLPRVPSY